MIYLITGGSGSGKSEYAEQKILSFGEKKRLYIATMAAYDEESKKRIARHRRMRAGKGFETAEIYTDLSSARVEEGSVALLECLSNLVANEMYLPEGAGERTVEAVLSGIRRLEALTDELVIVTNEVCSDIPAREKEMQRYLEYLGSINCAVAGGAAEVTEVVYGIPVTLYPAGGAARGSTEKAERKIREGMG